jgi:hypothetical protein
VQNPHLWSRYQSRKAELSSLYSQHGGAAVNELLLFHGTRQENVGKICRENVDWRRAGENVGHKHGQGASFALDLTHSHYYSTPAGDGTRVVFLSRVLVGMSTTGTSFMRYPPVWKSGVRYDTTVNQQVNPTIFVKYDATEYYPNYLILYSGCWK